MAARQGVGADGAEARAWRALAQGDPFTVLEITDAVPETERSLELRLARADAACRLDPLPLADLDELAAEVASAAAVGEADLGVQAWLAVVRAEHFMLWRTDPASLVEAMRALDALGDAPVLSERLLVARGRLRRVAAAWQLFVGQPDGLASGRALLGQSTEDLNRAGWEVERILTVVLFTMLASIAVADDLDDTALVIQEAADRLRRVQPLYVPVALAGVGFVAVRRGDPATARTALAQAASHDRVALRPFVESMRAEFEAAMEFLAAHGRGDPAGADAVVERAFEVFRSEYPHGLASMQVEFANLALDVGRWARARELLARAEHSPELLPYGHIGQRYIAARLQVQRGDVESGVQTVKDTCTVWRNIMSARAVALYMLRAARDCERVGALGHAGDLRAAAVADLPADTGRWTFWEALLARPLAEEADVSAGTDAAGAPALSPADRGPRWIRALGPDLVVERGGEGVTLPHGSALLLAVLVAERVPLTLDRLADLLWSEIDIQTGRTRVNTVVYRLRQALDLGRDELVRRGRDRVELDLGDRWRIDCWEFARLARGDVTAQRQAFELYEGDFCFRQLAYDEPVLGYRDHLRRMWVRVATELVRCGELPPAVVAERAELLGIDELALPE